MNTSLAATCYYCSKITSILQKMVDNDEVDENRIQELIDTWKVHSDIPRKWIQYLGIEEDEN